MDTRGYYRTPTIAGETIVFVCEDDLWSVDAGGGLARRLTAAPGGGSRCRGSRPTASTVAYVGRDEGNARGLHDPGRRRPAAPPDVPRQQRALRQRLVARRQRDLLHRPTPACRSSGKPVAFAVRPRRRRARGACRSATRCRSTSRPNGATLLGRNNIDPARWKRYRGGTAGHLWVDAAGSGTFARIGARAGRQPGAGRCGTAGASSSSPITKASATSTRRAPDGIGRATPDRRTRVLRALSVDRRRRASSTRAAARSSLLDPAARCERARVAIETPSAAPQTARRFVDAGDLLETFAPSPDGKALALVSRGHAYTMPLWEAAVSEHGARAGSRRRAIVWLHDGTRVAYVDDGVGLRAHRRRSRSIKSTPPHYVTKTDVGRITELVASPCGDRLAFANHRHELFVLDLGGDAAQARHEQSLALHRSRLLARRPLAGLRVVAEIEHDRSFASPTAADPAACTTSTEALREDRAPAWDPEGKYLYFISARDFNPDLRRAAVRPELSARDAALRRDACARDVPNPFVPVPGTAASGKDDERRRRGRGRRRRQSRRRPRRC